MTWTNSLIDNTVNNLRISLQYKSVLVSSTRLGYLNFTVNWDVYDQDWKLYI